MVDWLLATDASGPAETQMDPVVAGEIIILDPSEIEIGERLRPIDPVWALAIGQAMVRDGQIYPIDVCRSANDGNWLLAGPGGHRVTGARLVEMGGIEARVVSSNPTSRRRREAAENLFRRANDPIERAAAIAELVKLHKVSVGIDPNADQRTASAAARWQSAVKDEAKDANVTMTIAYGFSEVVANELGLSRATVERDLMLYRRLSPSLLARLRDARHPVATNATQLRALAKLDVTEQDRVVSDLLREGPHPSKSVNDAIAHLRGSNRAIDPEAKRLSTFIGTFGRMGVGEKKGALSELRPMLPAGHRLIDASTQSAPEDKYRVELLEALNAAFSVFVALSPDGEGADDDAIFEARMLVQRALFATHSGQIPAPKGDDA